MNETIPYSPAADRNKEAIGNALSEVLKNVSCVLEIGSGAAQHASYLCQKFQHLQWQVTEQPSHLAGLAAAVEEAALVNIFPPVALEVSRAAVTPPVGLSHAEYSLAYSANTAHIMSIEEVACMFSVVERLLSVTGSFALYGPFMIDGLHTSDGNEAFDESLKAQNPRMGIRDKADLQKLASECALHLEQDISMPANNRILVWSRG